MSGVNSGEAKLQQLAVTLSAVQQKPMSGPPAGTRLLQLFDPKTDELKVRVTALYEAYRDRIYCFLVSRGVGRAIAQEITQDVFVDLFVALKKPVQIESAQAWLYAVAARRAVDHWRREHCQEWIDSDLEPVAAANLPSSEPTPEAEAGHREELTRVAAGLRNLPKEQRLCIQLRAQGLRYREIAKILRVSKSTVAEWLVSAIDRLREQANEKPPVPRTVTAEFRRRTDEVRSATDERTSQDLSKLFG
jgi:RNA polymerase sigma-70 factor (ECF subfamily)